VGGFRDRLELINKVFHGVLNKLELFKEELEQFNTEQDYYDHYNKVKDGAINFIKNSTGYEKLINMNMQEFKIDNFGITDKHIWKHTSNGKRYISIDLKKANYQALKFLDPAIVNNSETYEDFISLFTDLKHIVNSKYIREVIFGNCCCKRHFAIEKFIMKKYLDCLLIYIPVSEIQVFSDDEIVFSYSGEGILNKIKEAVKEIPFTVRIEDFTVKNIIDTDMHLKLLTDGTTDFKCVPALYMPFVCRAYLDEPVKETDKMFYYEKMLSKLIDYPNITL